MIQDGTGGGEAVVDLLVLEGADEHFVNSREKHFSEKRVGAIVLVESLFDRVKNCGDYAAAGNNPYSLEQVIGIAFQLVYQNGIFVDD